MQSNGGVMAPETAQHACRSAMMESGPVGGIIAAAEVGRGLGFGNVIAFDMGGTTAKASLDPRQRADDRAGLLHRRLRRAAIRCMLPVVDIIEVGAGGGSIAWIDEVGALKVGPRSAGADPGPVCYGRGGTEPTVTDANVVLGRISPSAFLGGEMPLDVDRGARGDRASAIAEPLGLDSLEAAALGIVEIAIAEMSLAVRGVSVAARLRPARLRAGRLRRRRAAARGRDRARAAYPAGDRAARSPATSPPLGMLLTDLRHDYVQTIYARLDQTSTQTGRRRPTTGWPAARRAARRRAAPDRGQFLDMRYVGSGLHVAGSCRCGRTSPTTA